MVSRDFKGIWIPKEIWLDKNLTVHEKLFLAEIDSLDNSEGCFASNAYFADFFGVSKDRASKVISSLTEKGYITNKIIYKKDSKEIEKRVLRVSVKTQIGIGENADRGIGENTADITKNNITKNIYNYKDVLDYLNEKAGKNFKTAESNNKLIRARYKEGYTLEDFKAVIDYKVSKWKGTDMEQYLRPSTLFGNKFQNYVNEIPNRSINITKEVEDEDEDEKFKNLMDIFKGGFEDE